MSEETQKCSIIVFSGDMDKVMAGFIVATTAAAMGMETTMFFTFWGLKAIQKGTPTGKGLFGKMLSLMNRGGIDRLGPSRLNFGGIGRWMFKRMMKDQGVTSLPELRDMAIELDVKFLACLMSMDVMEISKEDLIDEVEDVVGAATFIAEAQESEIQLFI
ncbi:MAG: DsrE/DsrF/DrsH-like family protein [Anaerolineae bacterium]|jgi:peroxiredoxin family protein